MEKSYTIGQVARAAGIATSTVRYYERRGLLVPDGRSKGNYRVYGQGALERLRFVKAAQGAGFTLGDIEVLLGLGEQDGLPCEAVQRLIEGRLGAVRTQVEKLVRVEKMLEGWVKVCADLEAKGRCGVLEGLRKECGTDRENGCKEVGRVKKGVKKKIYRKCTDCP